VGKNPDEIEREIARKRSAIGSHMQDVQTRVRDDVVELRQSAEDQANHTMQQTKSKLDLSAQTKEHPLSMVAGALGLGVILGAASEGLPGGGSSSNGNGRSSQGNGGHSSSSNGGGGMISGLVTSVIGPAGETVRDELRQLVKDGFETFKSNSGLNQNEGQQQPQGPAQGPTPPPH